MTRWARALLSVLVMASPLGCFSDDRVVFIDTFAPVEGALTEAPESLHVYATDATVPLRVRATDPFLDVTRLTPIVDGDLELDPDTDITAESGILSFAVLTASTSGGAVQILDGAGAPVGTRELTVRAPDALAVELPCAALPEYTLPVVDEDDVPIFRGGKAGFRTPLFVDGEEIFGVRAVDAVPAVAGVTTRRGIACGPETCGVQRSASEISVPEAQADPFVVTLHAGTAELALTVAPVASADTLEVALVAARSDEGNASVVVEVGQGGRRVFGAPVAWTYDGVDVEGTGDVLTYVPTSDPERPLVARLGEELTGSVEIAARASDLHVTSLTAVCGAAPGGSAAGPLLAFALALVVVRRRRRAPAPPRSAR